MNPVDITLSARRLASGIIAFMIWTALAFVAGYLLKGHRDSLADAKVEAKQEAVTTTVATAAGAIDAQAAGRLKAQLAEATARAGTLQQLLKDQSHATPASPDCRLPDRLRDQINADLATGTR